MSGEPMMNDTGQAETPLIDHVTRAAELMEQGARMRLDDLPNDPSMLLASFGPDVTAEIARRLRDSFARDKRPTLDDLLAKCDPNAPLPEDREWLDAPAVGREII